MSITRRHLFSRVSAGLAAAVAAVIAPAAVRACAPRPLLSVVDLQQAMYCLNVSQDHEGVWNEQWRWDSTKKEWIFLGRTKSAPIMLNLGHGWLPPAELDQ